MDTVNKTNFRKLRIFVGCPGDVANCRDIVEEAAKSLKTTANAHQLELEIAHWGHVSPDAGRPQGVIFEHYPPETWDVFLGVLWHRFGTAPGAKHPVTGKEYLGGTEEEFSEGYRLWQANGNPKIKIYFCTKDYPSNLDIEQLQKVKIFQKELWDSYSALTVSFADEKEFKEIILRDLQKIILDFSQGQDTGEIIEVLEGVEQKAISNLPMRNDFFGREKDLKFVRSSISGESKQWGVFIDAIGGTGKTALAIEAAHQAKDDELFRAYIFITAKQNKLDSTGIVEENANSLAVDGFVNETARALGQIGITQLEHEDKKKALFDSLRKMPTLLVYDNLETLEITQQNAIERFVAEMPIESKAILTSRRQGLGLGRHLPLGKIEFDAAEKIIEKEVEIDGGLSAKLSKHRDIWIELYNETYGSPLALMHILGLMRVRRVLSIEKALELLRSKEGIEARIDFMFSEARNELNEDDKIVMHTLSFFITSADLAGLIGITKLGEKELEDAIDHLGKLCLLDFVEDFNRYRLHPLTKEFARKELQNNQQKLDEIGEAFSMYWWDFLESFGGVSSESHKTYDLLENEWDNIQSAINWFTSKANVTENAVGDEDYANVLSRITHLISQFLMYVGRWDEQISISEKAYTAMKLIGNNRAAGWHGYDVAYVFLNRRQISNAKEWGDKTITAWNLSMSENEKAAGLNLRGLIAIEEENYVEAERCFSEGLTLHTNMDNKNGIAISLGGLGNIFFLQERYDEAKEMAVKAIDITDKPGDKATYLANIGTLELMRGKYSEAREWHTKGLKFARDAGLQDLIAMSAMGLAEIEKKEGNISLALSYAQEALQIRKKLQSPYFEGTLKFINDLQKDSI